MRRFVFAGLSFLSLIGCVAGIAVAQMPSPSKKSSAALASAVDNRAPVPVTESTRVFLLARMRGMLVSTQGVAEATGKHDWQAAAAAARKSGLKAFQGIPKQVMVALPAGFRALGKQSHMAFDAVADAAMTSRDASVVSAKLGHAMQFCVACHAAYRFTTKP
jgi:hypothetical protein